MRALKALVICLALALLLSQFAAYSYLLDNLSNFPVHIAGAFLACAVLLAFLKSPRWALASAAGALLCVIRVLPWYLPAAEQRADLAAPAFKLLVANVNVRNRQHARLAGLVLAEQPDLVGLVEVNGSWLQALEPLRAAYPYRFEAPDESYFGLVLYSRLPLGDARVLRFGEARTPSIAATLHTPAGAIDFVLVHTLSPLNARSVTGRNEQLRALGEYVRAAQRPLILAGDLNVTLWNRNYRMFADLAGLGNARAGRGIGTTWPPVRALGIPIDHILATAPVELRDFRVLRDIGSDHLPISAEFSLESRAPEIRRAQADAPR